MPKRRKRRSRIIIIDPPAAEGVPSHASETPPTSRPSPIPAQDEVISIAPSTANFQSSSVSRTTNIMSQDNINKENRDPRIGRRRRSRLVIISSISVVPPKIDEVTSIPQLPLTNLDNSSCSSFTPNSPLIVPPAPPGPLPSPEELIEALHNPTPMSPTIAWRPPVFIDLPPVTSAWREWRRLTPIASPDLHYEYGYQIVPGEAYHPVPWYINRDHPWKLTEIELPPSKPTHVYRTDICDPRGSILTIPLIDCLSPSIKEDPRAQPIATDQELWEWLTNDQ